VKRLGSGARDSGADRTMPLVLPFENLTAGERYDYFSEGLTEEMITELWNSRGSILSITNLGCQLAGTAFQGTTLLCLRKTHDFRSTIPQIIA